MTLHTRVVAMSFCQGLGVAIEKIEAPAADDLSQQSVKPSPQLAIDGKQLILRRLRYARCHSTSAIDFARLEELVSL